MRKKAILIFTILLILPLLSSAGNAGCCFDKNKPAIFCTDTPTNCANYDAQAVCSASCYSVADACCLDTCTSAKIGSYASPIVCTDPAKFVTGACSQYSECRTGCVFCQNLPNSIGFYFMKDGQAECLAQKDVPMSWFYTTDDETVCPTIKQTTFAMYSVSGNVRDITDPTSPQVLPGATVSGAGRTATTNASGNYTLNDMPRGTYTITASKADYSSQVKTVTVSAALTNINFDLVRITAPPAVVGTLKGTVRDYNNNLVNGAVVNAGAYTYTTGSDGKYILSNIPVGTYTVTVTPPTTELQSAIETVSVIQATITKNFILQQRAVAMATLSLTVNPVGSTVVITKIGVPTPSVTETTDSATETFELVRANYTIVVYKENYETYSTQINLDSDKAQTITLTEITETRYVSGTVTDGMTGDELDAVAVFVPAPIPSLVRSAITDGNGYYKLEGLSPKLYTLIAQKAGYVEASIDVDLTLENKTGQDIELLPMECLVDTPLPEITSLNLEKAAGRTNVVLEYTHQCSPSVIYIQRCKGTACVPFPIAELSPQTLEFTDTNVEPGATYKYSVMAYYDYGFVGKVVSEPKTISLGEAECFSKDDRDEICLGSTRYECDENNTITELTDQVKKDLCIYSSETETEYVPEADCSQCNPPLGLFSYAGIVMIEEEGIPPYPVLCSEVESCYSDYTRTAVDKYLSCENVESCYDYKSEGACTANKCLKQMPCHWVDHVSSALGMGVCVPDEEKYHDCARCNQPGKFNELFLSCDEDLCERYGAFDEDRDNLYEPATEESSCYFTSDKKCVNKREASCEHYRNEGDCGTGNQDIVEVDTFVTNEITAPTEDFFGYEICAYNKPDSDFLNHCYKDANDDNLRDPYPKDMLLPYTVIVHPTQAKEINFDYVVYDTVNETPVTNAETWFSVTGTGQANFIKATGGKIKYSELDEGTHTVHYFSKDKAHNLEIIKSFDIEIDTTEPEITFSWLYGVGNDIIIKLEAEEIISCRAFMKNQAGARIQTEKDILFDEPGASFSRTYQLDDGIYYYNYTCNDMVGNPASEQKTMIVDRDNLVFNGQPSGTINYDYVTLSVETKIDAECRHSTNPMLTDTAYSAAEPLITNDKRHHLSSAFQLSNGAYAYYVRCRSKDTGELTRYSTVPKIAFSVDTTPPETVLKQSAEGWAQKKDIDFGCTDPPVFGLYPEFGCDTTKYCISNTDCTPTTEAKSVTVTAFSRLCYQSIDKGGNAEQIKCEDVQIDTEAPLVKITDVADELTKEDNVTVTAFVNNSALRQSNITEIEFRINGIEIINIIPGTTGTVSSQMTLPDELTKTPASAGNNGTLTVVAIDEAGNEGVSAPIIITVDKWGPDTPPDFEPALEEYDSVSYPLYYDGEIFYTNQEELYISGKTSEARETLEAWVNDISVSVTNQVAANATADTRFKTAFTVQKGSREVFVSGIPLAELRAHNGKYLKFETRSRTSYSNYGRFYRITAVAQAQNNIKLTLDAGVEANIPKGEKFTIYDAQMPSKSFIAEVPLENTTLEGGTNTFYLAQTDVLGNTGETSDSYEILYEGIPPVVTPPIGLTDELMRFHSLGNLNFTVTEQLGLKDVVLKANDEILGTETIELEGEGYIIHMPHVFEDGHYILELNVTDYAGNLASEEWEFDVDSFAPRKPNVSIITVPGITPYGTAPDGYMMTQNIEPVFKVVFEDDAVPVNISNARLRNLANEVECVKAAFNNYNCTIDELLQQRNYELVITAFKELVDRKANYAQYAFPFAIDTSPPELDNFELKNNFISTMPIEFTVDVLNENHPLKADVKLNLTESKIYRTNITAQTVLDIFFGTISQEELEEKGIYLSHDEEWTLRVNISDYAGNYNDDNEILIIIDKENSTLTNVVINAKPIYAIEETVSGERIYKYTIREDIINVTGTATDSGRSDVRKIEFFRANEQIGSTLKQCTSRKRINCFNSTTGKFTFKTNSTVIGEVGVVTPNILYIKVTDNALNEFTKPYFIYRDIEKPRVIICVDGKCVGEGPKEVTTITDVEEMKEKCGSNKDCYNLLITNACEEEDSPTECYKDYVIEIGKYELYELCDYTFLLRDQCLFDLAVETGVSSLCEYINFATLATKCVAATT